MWRGAQYDKVAEPQLRWGLSVLDRIPDIPIRRILDAGCGSGRVTEELLARFPDAEVVAVDKSASMLDVAEERLRIHRERLDLRHIDLADRVAVAGLGTFDLIVSTGTLHWIRDHRSLFSSFSGALRAGGVFVSQCGGAGSVQAVRDQLVKLGIDWRSFNSYASEPETEQHLRAVGFSDISCWLTTEAVAFDDDDAFVSYLLDGVIAPYLVDKQLEERYEIARAIALTLPARRLDFVRLNIFAVCCHADHA